jgi:glycosyltransferase involved in cell wall biosynthesis
MPPLKSQVATLDSVQRMTEGAALLPAKIGITIVVPCFNEEPALANLRTELSSMRESLERSYHVHVILVDDGSTDRTWQLMQELSQEFWRGCRDSQRNSASENGNCVLDRQ